MSNKNMTAELGLLKTEIFSTLYKSEDLIDALIGDTTGMTQEEVMAEFKKYVKPHLNSADTADAVKAFIFYDVSFSKSVASEKKCSVIIYVVCSRDIIDEYSRPGYCGNKADIISQMIENCLISGKDSANSFSIGELSLDRISPYNSRQYYCWMLSFSVSRFE